MNARLKQYSICLLLGGIAVGVFAAASAAPRQQDQTPAKQPGGSPEEVAFFNNEVLPVLKANCFRCHGDDKVRGGLFMVARTTLLKGGDTGPVIDLKEPDKSLLLKAINHEGELHMPPSPAGKLPAKEIELLTKWVKAGVPGIDDKLLAKAPAKKGPVITPEARNYWAYKTVVRPETPAVKDKDWVRNPIDAFVLSKLEDKGLSPAPPADALQIVRRVYYDLIGLPPTPEEVDAFVNDKAPDAYERLIERLLAMPQYGEKWARHWLDLVRFAETNGFEFDQNKPMVWRYRDYVIDAFNKDKPYDVFVREQIAGDLMPKPTPEQIIATGFYRLNQYDTGAADRNLQKYEALDSILSTTGQVFLGMSIGCARCHDHKADPILHRDYYKMLAFFHNITDLSGAKTRRVMAPADDKSQQKALKEKQDREVDLARQIYQLEQRFAVAFAEKKGLKVSDLPVSDLLDLQYRFYRDTWEVLPQFDGLLNETEGKVANNFFSLAPASRAEAIGLVFEGKLKVLQDGDYAFHLESTEGARLIIDGKRVLDFPGRGNHKATEKAKLKAGLLSVRLEYFNSYEKPRLKVEWSGPGFEKRPLTSDKGNDKVDIASLIKEHGSSTLADQDVDLYNRLAKELNQVRKTPVAQVGIEVSAVTEAGNNPTYIFIRGNPQAKSDKVDPGFPEVLLPPGKSAPVKGGRAELAQWLTEPTNPLPARVMANRLWQHHFGRGIVPSPNDFGKFGEQPTHPELLDWLASEFVAKGWKIKDMHRLLMTSNTYRMSSKGNEKALGVDASNVYFWRYNLRRLTSDEVRDSILAVSGKLNLKMGGPSVLPPIPREVLAGQARPGQGWKPSSPEEASRRSVYVFTKRSLLVPILQQFDMADTDQSCAVRFTTTVPTQALGLLNDQFSNDHAKVFASRLAKEAPNDLKAQVARAIRLTTGRIPSQDEVRKDIEFVQTMRTQNNLSEAEALRFYCLMVLNTNEFMYLD